MHVENEEEDDDDEENKIIEDVDGVILLPPLGTLSLPRRKKLLREYVTECYRECWHI
jgi:hypothetical protein